MKFNYKGKDISGEKVRELIGDRSFNLIVDRAMFSETTIVYLSVKVDKNTYDDGKLIIKNFPILFDSNLGGYRCQKW